MTIRAEQTATIKDWFALVILSLAVVLLAVDATVLSLAVPELTDDLDPTATQILWIGDIYSFAIAGLLITMGNLADRFGRKRLLLIGSIGFGIASVLAAYAPTAEMLILARALLGVSGSTLMPSTLSLIRTIFTNPRQRTRAIAVWSAGATAGAALGPLVGGALLEHFWWGSVFLINVPVMVVLVIGGLFLLPESRNPLKAPIDFLSSLLSILSIVPFVYAVKSLMMQQITAMSIAMFIVSLVAGYLFVRRQRKLATPLLDLKLFAIPAFSGAVLSSTISVFAFSGLIFFFSQYLQLVRGFSPLQAGISELPLTIASILVILIISWMLRTFGLGNALALGLVFMSVGLFALSAAEGVEQFIWLAISLAIIGVGVGISMTLATDAVVSSVPVARAGAASSIAETGYELGVALGIAILGSIQTMLYRLRLDLPDGVDERTEEVTRESLAAASHYLDISNPDAAEVLHSAQRAFTEGMQLAAVIAAILTIISAVIAWRTIPNITKTRVVKHQ